jgi:hypothetical protein
LLSPITGVIGTDKEDILMKRGAVRVGVLLVWMVLSWPIWPYLKGRWYAPVAMAPVLMVLWWVQNKWLLPLVPKEEPKDAESISRRGR